MKRSRRRMSRGFIAVLVLSIAVLSFCVLRQTLRSKLALKESSATTLSAVDVSAPDATQAQPAAAPTEVTVKLPPPIETVTPTAPVVPEPSISAANSTESNAAPPAMQDSIAGSAITASATVYPTSRPAGESASNWSRLLTTGSSSGSTTTAGAPATQPIVTGAGALADGKARLAAGELVDARAELNGALQAGTLSDADAASARSMVSDISQTLVFSPRLFVADPYSAAYVVKPGDSLSKIATAHQTTWEVLARINHLDPRRLRAGSTIKVLHGPFFAVVRKKAFAMDVYLGGLPGQPGSMYVQTFDVGLGKDDSTPTGTWAIAAHAKLKHPTYYPPEGGQPIEADDPANPLGGYWIALTGVDGQAVGRTSYGIHGTIDQSSIGKQASMGCIRLRAADIALVFDLMVEGESKVVVE
jgi:lipoprotein-anchoring transpeptidase ErfK/SrfK